MPTYPEFKTYRGGFYHNVNQNGVNDRVYSAEDLRMPYNVMFTDGIKPTEDGTVGDMLKVSATAGMGISVATGYAQLGGAWFVNDAVFNITLDYATTVDRYDCVIVRNDDNEAVREPMIYIKSLNNQPSVSDLERGNGVYEVCLAYVRVPAMEVQITPDDIVDTRDSGDLCNVMSGVGAMVVRTYRNTYYTEGEYQDVIPIGIPQYDRTRDRLTVIIEGRIFNDYSYTVDSNEQITLNLALPLVGTRVDFEVAKNVNAKGADTIVNEVGLLMQFMNSTNRILEYHYQCNGMTDNIELSNLAQTMLNTFGAFDYKQFVVHVHGYVGVVSPYSGSGTTTDPYVWFKLGKDTSHNRKIVFDFSDSSRILVRTGANTHDVIFGGNDIFMKNLLIRVEQPLDNTVGSVAVIGTRSGKVKLDDCSFTVEGSYNCTVAYTGILNDCKVHCTNTKSHSLALYGVNDSFLVINGGEFYSYSVGTFVSACLFVATASAGAIVKADKMSCPTVARDGYKQTHAIRDLSTSGNNTYRDTVTMLEVLADMQYVEGTARGSKSNRL